MASELVAPLTSAAAMFNCCSMIAGADRGKRDHHRDDLQVPDDISSRNPSALLDALLPRRSSSVAGARASRGADEEDDATQTTMIDALTSSMLLAPRSHQERDDRRTRRAAEAGAAADEAEDALGLARIVDVVGQRPELADQQDPRIGPSCRTRPRPSPRRWS